MTIALIPVKKLEESKSRLLSSLPSETRQALTLAMLEDLIEALSASRGITRIAVTTPDSTVAERAKAAGAEIIMRPEPGLNAALEDGVNCLALDKGEDILFVLGDVAGALAEDFDQLLREASEETRGIWLAPSSDGGTSALLHRPAGVVPCCFGKDSAARHREAAAEAAVKYHESPLLSLAIDLDQPEDLEAFLATKGGGRRTRALLTSAGLTPMKNA